MTPIESWKPWLVPLRPNPTAILKLFCFPYAGGSPYIFRSWPENLPSNVEIYGVQLPGRARRLAEPPIVRLPELIRKLGPAIQPALDQPYAFFGHSMGAILSFELARYLRRNGAPLPVRIFASGRRAPHIPDTDPPMHTMNDPEFLEEIARMNGTPREVLAHPELMQVVLPVLRGDMELCATYECAAEEPLPCSITAFGGAGDKESSGGRLQQWGVQTSGHFSSIMFPGDHFFIHSQEREFLAALRAELAQIAPARFLG